MTVVAYTLCGDCSTQHSLVVSAILQSVVVCPTWSSRVYVDTTCEQTIVTNLELLGAQVVRVYQCDSRCKLRILDDPDVDVVIVRDYAITFTKHEKATLEEWITSDKQACIIRHTPGFTLGVKRDPATLHCSAPYQVKTKDYPSATAYQEFVDEFTRLHGVSLSQYWCLPSDNRGPSRPSVTIMSSDRNPYYLDFWPVVSKIWREVVNVAPVLVIVDRAGSPMLDGNGLVLQYEHVPDVPTHLQAQNARIHAATLFGDVTVLTSDIDMMPLQADYFHRGIQESADGPVAMCADAYKGVDRFPLCYLVATGHYWRQAIGSSGWQEYVHMLNGLYPDVPGSPNHKWSIDEVYTSRRLIDHGVKRLAMWSEPLGLRCDRSNWNPDLTRIARREMIDAHLPRPYSQFKQEIDSVASTLLDESAHWPVQHALSPDADEFFSITNWNNHRPLLWFALQATHAGLVLELGAGEGSTPLLREYCSKAGRGLFTYDSNGDWARKFGVEHVLDWDLHGLWNTHYSVALVDHAPGEHRYVAMQLLATTTDIIVIHDSEPDHKGYMLDKIWGLFKYKVNLRRLDCEGAWATAVSNVCSFKNWPTAFSSCGVKYVVEVEK
jgi:hypothetical protein